MNLWESVTVALESIRGNKLRSFLTTMGIVIGIAAVMSVVAIGQGGRAMLMKELEKFGTNMFFIFVNYQEGQSTRPGDFREEDVTIIKQLVPEIEYMSPVRYSQMPVRGTRGQKSVRVNGTTGDYAQIRNMETQWGRFYTDNDQAVGRRVAVMDAELAEELFGRGNPVGKRVIIYGNPALVVGVLKKEESALGFNTRQEIYVPLSFLQQITGSNFIHELVGSAGSREDVYRAMERAQRIMERRHNAPGRYATHSMEQEMQSANQITGIMTLVVSFIAGISLLVGGIGVMNIMLVSVTERTREIGIRMALGARRRDILVQFLIESVVLCVLGGLIGIILGYGGAQLIAMVAKWPPLVSWWTALVAFLFSAVVGVFFGIYPANKASKLDPIEALRR